MGIRRQLHANIIRRWDALRSTEILREPLGPLQPGGCGVRSEYGNPRCSQPVRNTSDERSFWPYDNQVCRLGQGKLNNCIGVARIDCDALRPSRDAGIARRRDELAAARRLPKAPRERILTAARAQKQNIDGSS